MENCDQVTENIEWPTWALVVFVYLVWALLVTGYPVLPWYLAAPLLTLTLTLHSSLCHELIHGHPTSSQTINNFLGYPPLGLIFPYTVFRETHLQHHRNEDITYPGVDPESFFCTEDQWKRKGKLARVFSWIQMTLAGRMLTGPGTCFVQLTLQAMKDIVNAPFPRKFMWISHYIMIISLLTFVHYGLGIPAWEYALIAYFSLSLIQLRSYYEHQPVTTVSNRSVIQEASLPMAFLYLNNNYHYVHHQNPGMPWYRIKGEFESNREKYISENGNFHFNGYSNWLTNLFKPVHSPIHPFYNNEKPG